MFTTEEGISLLALNDDEGTYKNLHRENILLCVHSVKTSWGVLMD